MGDKLLNFRIKPDLEKKVKKEAEITGLTLTAIVTLALLYYFNKKKTKK